MTNRSKNIKKSNFVQQSTIDSGATFDFVVNGTNIKIPIADMIAVFGTTGTLEQLGEITGTPVLSKNGTVNRIRNILGVSGILTSTSPENGIQLDHNFTADTTGAPILKDPTAASPTIRSIVAGSGISVGVQNGSVQVSLSAVPVSNKTVTVNTLSDLPTPVAGVITLEANTQYIQLNDLSVGTNRLVLQECTVYSASDGTLITLTYTGTGNMFTSVDNSSKIKDIILSFPNGTAFDVDGSGTELFQVSGVRLFGKYGGDFDGMSGVSMQNILWGLTHGGMTFSGNNSIISFFQNIGQIDAGTFVDFGTSTFDGFTFTSSQGTLGATATFLAGAADSANVNTGGFATVINTRAQGLGTPLSGITTKDSLWEFFANAGIDDSRNSLLATNAGATITIAVIDTPVILGATWVEDDVSRFETTAGGRFTYVGKGAHINFSTSITADVSTGVKIPCTFYYFKNGTEITNSGVQRDFTAGSTGNFSMPWAEDLNTGDYIEIFAENNSTTADIVISQAIVRFS